MRGDYIKSFVEQDLVSWSMLQEHLTLHDDTFRELCMAFAQSAVIMAENFTSRVITPSLVNCYYDISDKTQYTFFIPFQTLEASPTFTIKVDNVEYAGTKKFIRTHTGKIVFDEYVKGNELHISYTPTAYALREALIPAILLMVGHYFTNRENNSAGSNPYTNAAIAILKTHRIKTQF